MTKEPLNCTVLLDVVSVDIMLRVGSAPLRGPSLDSEVAASIETSARRCARDSKYRIEILVPQEDMGRDAEVREAVHRHFEIEQTATSEELARTMRNGRLSTMVGLMVVACLLGIGHVLTQVNDGHFATAINESITIFSWVAMWRPAELLLYKHWPMRWRRALMCRLALADVVLIPHPRDRP